jgi:hypothetical protein
MALSVRDQINRHYFVTLGLSATYYRPLVHSPSLHGIRLAARSVGRPGRTFQ